MRSHPYTPPPPLPPFLSNISTYLQAGDRKAGEDRAVRLADLDPDTCRLLPRQHRSPHRVRVQGTLAVVRSVSVANLRSAGPLSLPRDGNAPLGAARGVAARGVVMERGPRSFDNCRSDARADHEADTQLRGYGIGGAGNIRRPTDVMGAPSRGSGSLSRLFSSSRSTSIPPATSEPDRKRWDVGGFLDRIRDHKRRKKTDMDHQAVSVRLARDQA